MANLTKTLNKELWLDSALAMIVTTGVQGLKVRDLAACIGSTTGSLYWHFKDRRSLIDALLEHWANHSTDEIALEIKTADLSPCDRLLLLLQLISKDKATESDLAIRAFAAFDPVAARVVARVDERRHEVVFGLFQDLGLREDTCEVRTRMVLCYESCERFVFPSIDDSDRERLRLERHRLYCAPDPTT